MRKLFFLFVFLTFAFSAQAAEEQVVVMNVKTYIYHNPVCQHARKCTKNCIKTTKQDAQKQGARACKVCGG